MNASHRAGGGSPLVLLHGLTGSWRIWRPVIPLLSDHHDVFVPSLAGHRLNRYGSSHPRAAKPLANVR